ncbi:uncharacterized protein LOC111343535 [Stylophora pistillata]|uniref:uncharacterized protein LOC111343535 n=1 Tax=Stylophora pistillata TaxID=50429 RepID=UPI000C0461E5|nr:uncharacterized protein LOC111343535 [Stylophora pistillata]
MRNCHLHFRSSVKSLKKITDIELHEIAPDFRRCESKGDTPGMILIHLRSESEKFRKYLEGRAFSVVEEDLQNDEKLCCVFVEASRECFVKRLPIYRDDSGKYKDEGSGGCYTSYRSFTQISTRKPLGGAIILEEDPGNDKCVGMIDFKHDETKTLSPLLLSSVLQPKGRAPEPAGEGQLQPQRNPAQVEGNINEQGNENKTGGERAQRAGQGEGRGEEEGAVGGGNNCSEQGSLQTLIKHGGTFVTGDSPTIEAPDPLRGDVSPEERPAEELRSISPHEKSPVRRKMSRFREILIGKKRRKRSPEKDEGQPEEG